MKQSIQKSVNASIQTIKYCSLLLLITVAHASSVPTIANPARVIIKTSCEVSSPCSVVNMASTRVLEAINNNSSQATIDKLIKSEVAPQFDFNLMTRYALGNNWKAANVSQQVELEASFKTLLVYTYSSALTKFKGAQITITDSSINGKRSSVITQVVLPNANGNAQPVSVEYDLSKPTGAINWQVYDIKIENASLVTNYRNQFDEIVQNSGIAGLIKELKNKIATING